MLVALVDMFSQITKQNTKVTYRTSLATIDIGRKTCLVERSLRRRRVLDVHMEEEIFHGTATIIDRRSFKLLVREGRQHVERTKEPPWRVGRERNPWSDISDR
jgi:hypothetical protein